VNGVPANMMRPSGWFQIGWSGDVAVGQIVPKTYFGEELVLFRDEAGTLHAIEAYCAHMGAHLAFGARVEGTCITCPFHGWQWNANGENVRIPYQDRPNRAVRMRVWPVMERNGLIYLWHDWTGGAPSWEPPDVFDELGVADRDYHDCHPDGEIRFGRLTLSPYVVVDNVADPAHFLTVHQSGLPIVVSSEADGHLFRVKLGFGSSWVNNPEDPSGDALDILQVGVGVSYTALGGSRSPYVVIVLSTTPVDDETSEMFQTVWLEVADGDDEPGRLATRMHRATHQLPRDIVIWENQRYVERPAWAANEVRGFTALRKWTATFYEPASSDT
jgi:3-ketosteroid 9alpha-monooxygenase subunit A